MPAPLHDPAPRRTPDGEVDWVRLHALVVAVEALVGAGMSAQARPLVGELRARIQALRGPTATVVELSSHTKR